MEYVVAVAQYGHPSFRVKHWAIVVLFNNDQGIAYQITGSSTTYQLKSVDSITFGSSDSYLGKVEVGRVSAGRLVEFGKCIGKGRIVHGDPTWNCQNWVIERLHDLRLENHPIRAVDHLKLLEEMTNAS